MRVCHAWRISHDEFLRWSKRSRDHAIWYLARVSTTCQSCGTRPEEWDDDHGGIRAYVWDLDQCRGCEVKEQGEEHLRNANDPKRSSSPYPRGTYVVMRRNEEVW